MIQNCKFDKSKDLGMVLQGLAPDLNQMLETHSVPSTGVETVYNQLEEVESIGFRLNDDFDAIMMSRALHAGIAPNKGTGSSQGPIPVQTPSNAE